jgi:hypothetical protein
MSDVIAAISAIILFLLAGLYVHSCERLKGGR